MTGAVLGGSGDSSAPAAGPSSLSRVQRRRQERIAAIVSAAARALGGSGYWRFSLGEVAEAVDLTESALYHYFPSKDALVSAAIEQLGATAIARIELAMRDDEASTPPGRLRAGVTEQLTILMRDLPEAKAIFAREGDWPEAHRQHINALRRRHHRIFEAVVGEGVASGTLVLDSVDVALDCFHGAVNSASHHYRPRSEPELRERIAQSADVVLRLFGVAGTPASTVETRLVVGAAGQRP